MIGEKVLFLGVALIALGFLILIHEFGHFMFCRLFGVPAPIFSIGFGPRIFARTYKGTTFILAAIPLGGYVAMGDEQGEVHQHDDINPLMRYPLYKGALIMLGGIFCNFLLSYLLCIGLSVSKTLEKSSLKFLLSTSVVESVLEDSCAERMGLQPGDLITCINGKKIDSGIDLRVFFSQAASERVRVMHVIRNHNKLELVDTQEADACTSLGVACSLERYQDFSFFDRISYGAKIASRMIKETVYGLYGFLKHRKIKNFSGFIGILRAGTSAAQESLASLFATVALISINLAVLNLLPLPMLDGGQLLLLTVSKVFGRPLPSRVQQIFFYFSLLVIGLLTLFTTFYDIMRWIGWA